MNNITKTLLGSVLVLGSLFTGVTEAKATVHWEKSVDYSGKTVITYYDDQNGQQGEITHRNQNPNIPHVRWVNGQIPGQQRVSFMVQCDSNPRILSGMIGLNSVSGSQIDPGYNAYARFACSFNP